MKTLSDILRKDPVWVNPAHRIESVIFLMRGHNIDGIPVIENKKLVGIVLYKHLLGVDPHTEVSDVMQRDISPAAPDMSVRDAAERMMQERIDRIPVLTSDGILLGVITNSDLLAELRRATDPLTELLWSDSMREWAIEKLRSGHEITILFIDIDGFGMFNKSYGHVVGDSVLRNVSNVLRDATDSSLDLVCRYGGDEFCIATLRAPSDSIELARFITQEISNLRVMEACGEAISISIGMRGGRRTKERDQIHYAATLNNLINLASRDCLLKKATKAVSHASYTDIPPSEHTIDIYADEISVEVPPSAPNHSIEKSSMPAANPHIQADFLHLARLSISEESKLTKVLVALEANQQSRTRTDVADTSSSDNHEHNHFQELHDFSAEALPNRQYVGELSRKSDSIGLKKLVAETTMAAYRKALPPEHDLRLNEVLTAHTEDGRTLVTVIGHYLTPDDARPIAGSAFVNMDIHRAVAMAVLAAVNLQFRRIWAPMTSETRNPFPT